MIKVFLGGTCPGWKWRDELVAMLNENVSCFNPIVKNWNEEAQARELEERASCDFCLYVITPDMKGVYSIAEVVDDSNKRPGKTVFASLRTEQQDPKNAYSLGAVAGLVKRNGGQCFQSLEQIAEFLNGKV